MAPLFTVTVMDKSKVIIIGGGPQSRWMEEALSRHPALFDVEVREFGVGTIGHKPEVFIIEDLMVSDFAAVEERVFADMLRDGWAGKQILFDGTHLTVSAVEAHQIHKDIMFPEYYGHRGMGKSMLNALRVKAQFAEVPADHPTRKREPKGPRNKWGKLK